MGCWRFLTLFLLLFLHTTCRLEQSRSKSGIGAKQWKKWIAFVALLTISLVHALEFPCCSLTLFESCPSHVKNPQQSMTAACKRGNCAPSLACISKQLRGMAFTPSIGDNLSTASGRFHRTRCVEILGFFARALVAMTTSNIKKGTRTILSKDELHPRAVPNPQPSYSIAELS